MGERVIAGISGASREVSHPCFPKMQLWVACRTPRECWRFLLYRGILGGVLVAEGVGVVEVEVRVKKDG